VKRVAGIPVRVYAVGLYVDLRAARAAVGDRFVGGRAVDVAKDPSLFAAVLSSPDVEKTVRLVLARDVDSSKIRDALSERLKPVLGAGSPSLKEFEGYFDGIMFKKAGGAAAGGDGPDLNPEP
jgi:hypothetical protein